MSKERELLRRVIDGGGSYNAMESLDKEIEEFLAQPEHLSPIEKHETFLKSLIPPP